jgi:hypothetical protein
VFISTMALVANHYIIILTGTESAFCVICLHVGGAVLTGPEIQTITIIIMGTNLRIPSS